jgi:methionine synthase II (cobalamin-independent)
MNKPEITKDIYIEDLVNHYPFSVRYLSQKGIKCIACGEPIWGTLEEAAQEKNFADDQIAEVVEELRQKAVEGSGS